MNPIQNSVTNPASGSIQKVETSTKRNPAGAAAPVAAGAVGTQAGGDMVSISNSARLLNTSATTTTSGATDLKLSELKSAIASGHYTVDPQKIAQGLLRDSQALQKASGR
ncbi:anti-sigma-28 factor, FlgM [mine drainage metagenome]|uniref:Negative regulator of flagellin synthesis n=1 Tax=mine drainage metagenome TaxID=410659 RepID=A0A1J5R156_9ZZZZ